MSKDTKVALWGVLFWPLWMTLIGRARFPQLLKILITIVLLIGYLAVLTGAAATIIFIGLPSFFWALSARQPDTPVVVEPTPVVTATSRWRDQAEADLEQSDRIIVDIETDHLTELYPDAVRAIEVYRAGLELRSQGISALSASTTETQARSAAQTVKRGLVKLQSAERLFLLAAERAEKRRK